MIKLYQVGEGNQLYICYYADLPKIPNRCCRICLDVYNTSLPRNDKINDHWAASFTGQNVEYTTQNDLSFACERIYMQEELAQNLASYQYIMLYRGNVRRPKSQLQIKYDNSFACSDHFRVS